MGGCNSAGIATFLIKVKALSSFIVPCSYGTAREGEAVGIGGIEPDFHLRTLLANGYSIYPVTLIGSSIIGSPVQGNVCTFHGLCEVVRRKLGSNLIFIGEIGFHLLELIVIQACIKNHQFGYSTRPWVSPRLLPHQYLQGWRFAI